MDSYKMIAPSIKTFDSYPDSYHRDAFDSYHRDALDSYSDSYHKDAFDSYHTRTRSIAMCVCGFNICGLRYGPSQHIHLSKPSDIFNSI